MANVCLRQLGKTYGNVVALDNINLDIADGEFVVLVGPSGCGKSTLLRCISGLEPISAGQILIEDSDVTGKEPVERGIGMVFQSYALYPHMTVERNIGFGLKIARRDKAEIKKVVQEVAEILKLDRLLDRKPRSLSGGQRQRVAIGRSLARRPKIFLFDEPLSNLDAGLRVEMRVELSRLHNELKSTMIYVTHDQVEAMTMANRIVVMDNGKIMQTGSPLELFNKPCNRFVAGFLGQPATNFLKVSSVQQGEKRTTYRISGGSVTFQSAAPAVDTAVEVGLRPDAFLVAESGGDLTCMVELAEQLGDETLLHARLESGEALTVKMRGQHRFNLNKTIGLIVRPAEGMAFNQAGRNLFACTTP